MWTRRTAHGRPPSPDIPGMLGEKDSQELDMVESEAIGCPVRWAKTRTALVSALQMSLVVSVLAQPL